MSRNQLRVLHSLLCVGYWRLPRYRNSGTILRVCLGMLLVFCASMSAAAMPLEHADHVLIEQLPARLHEQIARADNIPEGNTSAQAKNMERCNKALVEMIYDLGSRFYGTKAPSREAVDTYAKNLCAIYEFRQRIASHSHQPSDEEAALEISNHVYKFLLDTIDEMVVAVTKSDRQFDYQAWKKRWERAKLSDTGM
jgi:hypothetical protein